MSENQFIYLVLYLVPPSQEAVHELHNDHGHDGPVHGYDSSAEPLQSKPPAMPRIQLLVLRLVPVPQVTEHEPKNCQDVQVAIFIFTIEIHKRKLLTVTLQICFVAKTVT